MSALQVRNISLNPRETRKLTKEAIATPNSSSTSSDAVPSSSSSSYSKVSPSRHLAQRLSHPAAALTPSPSSTQPGRGLPVELLIKIVQAPVKLKQRDYLQWALASRVFLQPALDKLYECVDIHLEEAHHREKAVYLSPKDHIVWRRLSRLDVARRTRVLSIFLLAPGYGGHQPDPEGDFGAPIEDTPGGLVLDGWADLHNLLRTLVNLDELHIRDDHLIGPTGIDYGTLPALRTMTLTNFDLDLVVAAPRLVRLTTAVSGLCDMPEQVAPQLRELVITEGRAGRHDSLCMRNFVEWLTPSTLTSLDIPAPGVPAPVLLPILEDNLPRWPSFRTFRLQLIPWGATWTDERRVEVKALGVKHGFEVLEAKLRGSCYR